MHHAGALLYLFECLSEFKFQISNLNSFGLSLGFWFLIPISYLKLTQPNLFEFKQNLNSTTLCTQAIKINAPAWMQQQSLTYDKILITWVTKTGLNAILTQ